MSTLLGVESWYRESASLQDTWEGLEREILRTPEPSDDLMTRWVQMTQRTGRYTENPEILGKALLWFSEPDHPYGEEYQDAYDDLLGNHLEMGTLVPMGQFSLLEENTWDHLRREAFESLYGVYSEGNLEEWYEQYQKLLEIWEYIASRRSTSHPWGLLHAAAQSSDKQELFDLLFRDSQGRTPVDLLRSMVNHASNEWQGMTWSSEVPHQVNPIREVISWVEEGAHSWADLGESSESATRRRARRQRDFEEVLKELKDEEGDESEVLGRLQDMLNEVIEEESIRHSGCAESSGAGKRGGGGFLSGKSRRSC